MKSRFATDSTRHDCHYLIDLIEALVLAVLMIFAVHFVRAPMHVAQTILVVRFGLEHYGQVRYASVHVGRCFCLVLTPAEARLA